MPVFKTSGVELYYETHGSGPAIVFAHGAGGNHLAWYQQVPFFRDRYTCHYIRPPRLWAVTGFATGGSAPAFR
ncbi:MAG TPA: alpha/beta hydrolase [Dehalococcoidia bacterium]